MDVSHSSSMAILLQDILRREVHRHKVQADTTPQDHKVELKVVLLSVDV